MLFKVIERSGNLRITPLPPIALRTRVVSYTLGAYKVFIKSFVVEATKRAHSTGNWEHKCLFYYSKVIRGQIAPPLRPLLPQTLPIKI
jgi:hypothetical protein